MPRINLPATIGDLEFDTDDLMIDLAQELSTQETVEFVIALDVSIGDDNFSEDVVNGIIDNLIDAQEMDSIDLIINHIERRTKKTVKRQPKRTKKKVETVTKPKPRPSRFTEIDIV